LHAERLQGEHTESSRGLVSMRYGFPRSRE
jgi:hypothetical protein